MNISEITQFVDLTLSDDIGKGIYNRDENRKVRVLSQALKINEEAGELSSEILGYLQLVRKEKLNNYSQETLESEIADVIISTFRLARFLSINMEDILTKRIEVLKNRISGN